MYVAVGYVTKSTDNKLRPGNLLATTMSKKYSMTKPYPMILLREDKLVIVEVKWLEFVKIDRKTTREEIEKLEAYLIEKWSKQRRITDFQMS